MFSQATTMYVLRQSLSDLPSAYLRRHLYIRIYPSILPRLFHLETLNTHSGIKFHHNTLEVS